MEFILLLSFLKRIDGRSSSVLIEEIIALDENATQL